jgi:hypothetical protein
MKIWHSAVSLFHFMSCLQAHFFSCEQIMFMSMMRHSVFSVPPPLHGL